MGLVFEKETYGILGAIFEVYKEKGARFLEAVYQECLEIEFELRGMPFAAKSGVGNQPPDFTTPRFTTISSVSCVF